MAGVRVVLRLDQAAVHQLLNSEAGPVGKMLIRMSLRVHNAAKRLCPVDTGRLRASIQWSLAVTAGELVGIVYFSVFYGLYQELGTRYMPAHPFMRPALRAA